MKAIRAWNGVRRIKRRRVQQAEGALKEAFAAAEQAERALVSAREEMLLRQVDHERVQQQLRDLYDGTTTFQSTLALQRHDQLSQSEAALGEASHAVAQAEQRTKACRQEVVSARRELDRRGQQLQRLDDEIRRLGAIAEEQRTDQEDEDAEEAAVSRLLGRRRDEEEIRHDGRA